MVFDTHRLPTRNAGKKSVKLKNVQNVNLGIQQTKNSYEKVTPGSQSKLI